MGLDDKCKTFFQLMVIVFNGNKNFSFYSSMFVIETVFISEQITEYRLEALLEISYIFSTKSNVFSYMILQLRLGKVWKIS